MKEKRKEERKAKEKAMEHEEGTAFDLNISEACWRNDTEDSDDDGYSTE